MLLFLCIAKGGGKQTPPTVSYPAFVIDTKHIMVRLVIFKAM